MAAVGSFSCKHIQDEPGTLSTFTIVYLADGNQGMRRTQQGW